MLLGTDAVFVTLVFFEKSRFTFVMVISESYYSNSINYLNKYYSWSFLLGLSMRHWLSGIAWICAIFNCLFISCFLINFCSYFIIFLIWNFIGILKMLLFWCIDLQKRSKQPGTFWDCNLTTVVSIIFFPSFTKIIIHEFFKGWLRNCYPVFDKSFSC